MDADFPAAHSMDTAWYAVDADGHVACFFSGEDGHVPRAAGEAPHEGDPVRDWIRSLCDSGTEEWWSPEDEDFARIGFYGYSAAEPVGWFHWPYVRYLTPERPLHVDQAPPKVRAAFQRVQFPVLRFGESERVQPIESYECDAWDEQPAYVAGDGQTVRAVPGEEANFWYAYEEDHEGFEGLRFELPPRPPEEDE
jgi:hypothetical protein